MLLCHLISYLLRYQFPDDRIPLYVKFQVPMRGANQVIVNDKLKWLLRSFGESICSVSLVESTIIFT